MERELSAISYKSSIVAAIIITCQSCKKDRMEKENRSCAKQGFNIRYSPPIPIPQCEFWSRTNNLKSTPSNLSVYDSLDIIQTAHRMCCTSRATPRFAPRTASRQLWSGPDTLRRCTTSAASSTMTRTRSARVTDTRRLLVTAVSFLHIIKKINMLDFELVIAFWFW
jgi:hypothetical protein